MRMGRVTAMWLPWASRLVGALLVAAGCGGPPRAEAPSWDWDDDGGATTGPGAAPPIPSSRETTTSATVQWPDLDGGDDDDSSGSMPGVVFLLAPDTPPPSFECDIFEQDCPDGEKCMIVPDPEGHWSRTRCRPILGEPAAPGEPCTVLGSVSSGIDSCEVGSVCWRVDPDDLEGTCIAFCTGNEDSPTCEDPNTQCNYSDQWPFAVCVSQCDPVQQDCPGGEACYPIQGDWTCAPDASGEGDGYGDPCEFINVCDPGYVCLDDATVPPGEPCDGTGGCCTAICDLSDPLGDAQCEGAAGGQTCQPWYEEGTAPPGYEDVGACALPQ